MADSTVDYEIIKKTIYVDNIQLKYNDKPLPHRSRSTYTQYIQFIDYYTQNNTETSLVVVNFFIGNQTNYTLY